jgi:hypothetical protein
MSGHPMLEVRLDENKLFAFDGRVLEIFGGSVRRFHVALLTVAVHARDKRGNIAITFTQAQSESSYPVDEAGLESLRPILDALQAAGVRIVTDPR